MGKVLCGVTLPCAASSVASFPSDWPFLTPADTEALQIRSTFNRTMQGQEHFVLP